MSKRNVVIVAAHPDDEVLMAGGAMARHIDAGDTGAILILATGATSRGGDQSKYMKDLQAHAQAAARELGVSNVEFGSFPDNKMDSVPLLDVIKRVEDFLEKCRADVIYTHHAGDLNIDHRIVHQAVVTACRPVPDTRHVEIFAGETNSATEWASPSMPPFVPTDFLDITGAIDRKARSLACYTGELRQWPHPRSDEGVRVLARWRGTQSGFEAAEAFVVVRRVRANP